MSGLTRPESSTRHYLYEGSQSSCQLVVRLHSTFLNYTIFVRIPGEYAGFDESQPTAESGGKGKVISTLKEQYGFKTVVMIGDGATDLEACPPAVSVRVVSCAALTDVSCAHICVFDS